MFQFPGFPPSRLCVQRAVTASAAGFPHSDIAGSPPAHGSPTLFTVCHVLLRLLTPRHPPFAFVRLSRHTETAFQRRCVSTSLSFFRIDALLTSIRFLNPQEASASCAWDGPRKIASSVVVQSGYSTLTMEFSKGFPPEKISQSSGSARCTVGLTRLERVTSPLSEECSNRLSYRPRPTTFSGRFSSFLMKINKIHQV